MEFVTPIGSTAAQPGEPMTSRSRLKNIRNDLILQAAMSYVQR